MFIMILEISLQEFRGVVQKLIGFYCVIIIFLCKMLEFKILSCGEEIYFCYVDYDGDDGDFVVDFQEQNFLYSMFFG